MYQFLVEHQLNIMLGLSFACFTMALLLLITKFLTKKRKWILVAMEVMASLLLFFDRQAYMYSGNVTKTGLIMVRVSNFLVFFLTSGIVFGFTLYIIDLLLVEGEMESIPRRLQVVAVAAMLGMVLAIVASFTGLYYTFDSMNVYHRGPGFLISYIIPVGGTLTLYTVIRQYKNKFSRIIYTALVLYVFGPITCGIIQLFAYGISIVNMAMVLVSIFLYIFTYMDINNTVMRAHEIEMQRLQEDRKSMKRLFDQTATAFVAAMEKKDGFGQGHSAKTAEMAGRLAKAYGKSPDEVDEIYFAALLHNVGILGVPDGLVENFRNLSPEQYEVFKQTPLISAEILSNIKEYPILSVAAKYAHERYDGNGFPEGLKGEEIPEVARIMAVVDAFDYMTTKTRYSDPLPEPIVREEFVKEAGISLDPELAALMVEVLDQIRSEDVSKDSRPWDAIEKELVCENYRDAITSGVIIDGNSTSICFFCEPRKKKESDFSAPSIIIFDSYDRRVHSNAKAIDAFKYMEYGEVWFDGHSVSTDARNMEVHIEEVDEDPGAWEEGKYIILATKYEDHVKIAMTDGRRDIDVTIALPDSSKYASVAITGEHCYIRDIALEKSEEETLEGDIERIAEAVSYTQRLESDIPNLQVDRHRSTYSEGIELDGTTTIEFHTMSLPASNLVWHCPYVILFYSEDGKVGGPGYKEFVQIKLNGEIDKSELYARNSFTMKKHEDFPGWNEWKEVNKRGMECSVKLVKKADSVILKTSNLGIEVQNTTVITDGGDKVYVALTGDMVAITDIRIK